jgi:hypothetical protein
MKKVKEFRDMAREVIDDSKKPKLGALNDKRTKEEEEMLNEKIRKLQKENPHIDYT